tara:strand:+ start:80 stop:496 length:417 start_codon:yes stop_codon:yes gene_type:complete
MMASIYSRIDKNGNKKYYGSIYLNGKRTRKYLSCSKQSAETLIKKLEYELLINIQTNDNESHETSFEKAILSFIKEVERTSVKVKQINDINTKLNYFKNHCFLINIQKLNEINRKHANDYIKNRCMSKLKPSTLNMEF